MHVSLLFKLLSPHFLAASPATDGGGLNLATPLLIPKSLLLGSPNAVNFAVPASKLNVLVMKFRRIGIVRALLGCIGLDATSARYF